MEGFACSLTLPAVRAKGGSVCAVAVEHVLLQGMERYIHRLDTRC